MNWGIWGQTYHALCDAIWGKDLTVVLMDKWNMTGYQVHEVLLAWALFLVFWAYIVLPLVIFIIWLIRRQHERFGN
jgi:hypothetical protein